MKQLSPLDSLFYHMETPSQPMVIATLWICDQSKAPNGIVRHKEILEYVESRLSTNSMFRRRLQPAPLELDEPYWLEDENFDLEYHVRHVGLPQPGDWRQLCIFTSRLMSRSMDKERAPWELYIIEGLNNVEGVPENSFAVLLRMHHAYADGKTGIEMSKALLQNSPHHDADNRAPVYVERAPTKVEMWSRTAPRLLSQGYRSLKAGWKTTGKGLQVLNKLKGEARPDQNHAPQTIFNTQVSPHRTYGALTWKIPELTAMRRLCKDASLNDVILGIVGGGLRRYLKKHDALPDSDSLISMCPVAVRSEAANDAGGNLVSSMYISVGTDVEDPVERLGLIHERTARAIPLARNEVAGLSDNALEVVPPYLRQALFWGVNKLNVGSKWPAFNVIVTNVPGPMGMEKKYFAGAELVNMYPMVPIANGCAITHGITGVYDQLNLGVLSDRVVVTDMDFYIECMKESTEEYRQLLQLPDQQQNAVDTEADDEGKTVKKTERKNDQPITE